MDAFRRLDTFAQRERDDDDGGDDDDGDAKPTTRALAGWTDFDPNKVAVRKRKAAKGSFKSKGRFKRR